MKLLIDLNDLSNYKSRDKIPLECELCKTTFFKYKSQIQAAIKGTRVIKYCSVQCKRKTDFKSKEFKCGQCSSSIYRSPSRVNSSRRKFDSFFCNIKCASQYAQSHKSKGHNVSKLEKYLQNKLTIIYPNIKFEFNNRNILNGLELDIYIPSLKLAFELNGIVHYEPIYGIETLIKIQQKDKKKTILCSENNIDLFTINTSKIRYLKENKINEFLLIITNIIDSKF